MKNLRILVAEDESIVALDLISQLQELGHDVVGDVADGLEAVELCGKLKPDLVLMDINMPRLNGIKAAWAVKERYGIPVIIVSGYSDQDLIQDAATAGVSNYLVKPVTTRNLAPAIELTLHNFTKLAKTSAENDLLKKTLEERKLVEKAKGIVMQQKQLSEAEAMKTLQRLCNNKNVKLVEMAKEIINNYQP